MKKGHDNPQLVTFIISLVCKHYNCTHAQIKSALEASQARDMLAFLLRKEHQMTLKTTKEAVGISADGTLYAACKRADGLIDSKDTAFMQKLSAIRAAILAHAIGGTVPEAGAAASGSGEAGSTDGPVLSDEKLAATAAKYCGLGLLFSADPVEAVNKARRGLLVELFQSQKFPPQVIAAKLGIPLEDVYAAIGEWFVASAGQIGQ